MGFRIFSLILCCYLSLPVQAMPHRLAADHKSNQYLSEGVFIGGRSGLGVSLLDVRRSFDNKTNIERIVLDWGDQKARPLKGAIGFFHVGIDKAHNRAIVDLSQVALSGLDEAEVIRRFKTSPLVKKAQLIFDPISVSTQLILEFKKPVAIESFYLVNANDPSRLVLDLRPLTAGKKL